MDEVVDSSEESHLRLIGGFLSKIVSTTSGILLQGKRPASLTTAVEPDPTQYELRNIKSSFYYNSEGLISNGFANYLRHCSSLIHVTVLNYDVLKFFILSSSSVGLDPKRNELLK